MSEGFKGLKRPKRITPLTLLLSHSLTPLSYNNINSMEVGIPKGTRDFLPIEVARRKWMFGIIEEVFKVYGYVPIEKPVLENLSTLTTKYGEEGDRLLFKV